ncbi:MAG TPA: cytochrome ubiquinol oxidase subunit I [Alphaproteobacteria bacterium]|nr:cytochrome ubiquinol oxidase subunit I [Alphaproteobacteria bacterium]MDP6272279.1 cytochrome ubiquinol oxidase subunit I [Alphaproteobacteria bacterium]MDP7429008.1 cytochrome ubiquinol oxidase subunit I [Alphaproteobacteria bacterium]HJM50126.1 cytochrome ubiquinol oxidase subunit I [Alphaproteobacteria bacterium]
MTHSKVLTAWRPWVLAALVATLLLALVPLLGSALDIASPALAAEGEAAAAASGEQAAAPAGPTIAPPKLKSTDYPVVAGVNGRIFVWLAAQLHLWFAAFVLAVPIFVFIIEAIGMYSRDQRYDNMAYEFIKVSITAYSLTAILGGLLAIGLIVFYPHLFQYMSGVFKESMVWYAVLFFAESACLYIYYYGWHWLQGGFRKWVHLTLGLVLNGVGTTLMFLANAWLTFQMSPAGVDAAGLYSGDVWAAIHNPLWNPINLHRMIANVAYGGSVVGAYAAFRFLSSRTAELRAHYDWMGYTANFIAISALLPLPFAGYYLTAEIYAYSQQMGITLMGGVFAWLFIIQAVLIGTLFLSANYYLWCGMGRSDGAPRYNPYIKYIAFGLVASFLVWFTPHTLVLTNEELKALGGPYHKYLGPLGIMPAKNTAVNYMIILTALSFLIYRRANKIPTVSWVKIGNAVQVAMFTAAVVNILILGVYHGYFTNTVYKVASSIPQVLTTLVVIFVSTLIDVFMYRGAKDVAPLHWGRLPERAQYALFLLAVSFTWLMGLMGYIRSGIRQHWHVVGIFRDNSADAFTPTLAGGANIVSVGVIIFLVMVIFVFWVSQISGRKTEVAGYWRT